MSQPINGGLRSGFHRVTPARQPIVFATQVSMHQKLRNHGGVERR
jgi:hypothetical protein